MAKCSRCGFDNPSATRFCGNCAAPLHPEGAEHGLRTETFETSPVGLATGSTFAGRYQVIEELGRGGMGRVYKVYDTEVQEKVALKLLNSEIASDREVIQRFRRELKLARTVSHKNVCRMYDLGQKEGVYYITMEYVAGENLKTFIQQSGRLSVAKAIGIGAEVCAGLAEAHRHGIIHRDLKPQNIMIDQDGNARIMDFGIARSLAATGITNPGVIIGTLNYMSPEQVKGEATDQRSDIFSLGVILFEMLTGRVPFEGDTPFAIANEHKIKALPDLREFNEQIPESLNRLVLRCLERVRGKRFQRAEDLLEEFRVLGETNLITPAAFAPRKRTTKAGRKLSRAILIPSAIAGALAVIAMAAIFLPRSGRDPAAPGVRPPTPIAWKNSVAILPFVNMSADHEQEYFCDGLTEELITKLSQIQELKVAARTSAFVFKGKNTDIRDVGQKLRVENILEGSVRRSGSRMRITAQLISAADGYHLWSDNYDREVGDILAVQDEIANSVAGTLRVALLGDERAAPETRDSEAYNAYLMGNYLYRQQARESLERARSSYEKAVQLDPGFARAWAGLGATYTFQAANGYIASKEGFEAAKSAIKKALALDKNLAYAHRVHGWIQMSCDYDWTAAEASYRKAVLLEPARGAVEMAQLSVALGRFDTAAALARRAAEIDPISVQPYATLGLAYWYGGRFEEAVAAYRRIQEFNPEFSPLHGLIGLVHLTQLKAQEALVELDQAKDPFWRLPGMAMFYHTQGRKTESDAALAEYTDKYKAGGAYNIAQVYAFRGQAGPAFAWLDKAYAQHDGGMFLCNVDPLLKNLRGDPRFKALLKKMRFPASGSASRVGTKAAP